MKRIFVPLLLATTTVAGAQSKATNKTASPPTLLARLQGAVGTDWGNSLEAPTPGQLAELDLVRSKYGAILAQIRQLIQVELNGLEQSAEQAGVPWTSGRFPKPPA